MTYTLFLIKLFLVDVILIIQLFTLGKFSKILKWLNTKIIHVMPGAQNFPEFI